MEINKNICFLNSVKSWGGGEKWHFDMAKRLKEKEYNVHFFCNRNSVLENKLAKTGIPTHSVSIGNISFLNIFKLIHLARLFKRERTDYLIMNGSSDLKTAGIAAKAAGVKRIIYRRGSAIPIKNTFFNRFLFKNIVTDVIANSEATRRTINEKNPKMFPTEKIKVIYNGIDTDHLPSLPSTITKKKEDIIIGNAARLAPQKGHELLIEIAKELKKITSKFKILLAGDGPLKEHVKKLIVQNNLQKNVILLGFESDIYRFMDSIDIFILTSKWEGFGFVLAEAMLRKKPIVAWDLSSNPELVNHGQNGLLTEPYNIIEFTSNILSLMENPAKRQEFGAFGYEYAIQNFSIESSTKALCEFLKI